MSVRRDSFRNNARRLTCALDSKRKKPRPCELDDIEGLVHGVAEMTDPAQPSPAYLLEIQIPALIHERRPSCKRNTSQSGQSSTNESTSPLSRRLSRQEIEDFYRTPNFRTIFAGVFMYTQATLCTVAWCIGGPINDGTAPGVITAILMSLGLLLATVWPFVEEVRARNYAEEIPGEGDL